jgi:Flp pilus assembly protein protease CpaA
MKRSQVIVSFSELSSTLLEGLAAFTPGLLGGGDNKDMCVVWSFGSAIAGHIDDK